MASEEASAPPHDRFKGREMHLRLHTSLRMMWQPGIRPRPFFLISLKTCQATWKNRAWGLGVSGASFLATVDCFIDSRRSAHIVFSIFHLWLVDEHVYFAIVETNHFRSPEPSISSKAPPPNNPSWLFFDISEPPVFENRTKSESPKMSDQNIWKMKTSSPEVT